MKREHLKKGIVMCLILALSLLGSVSCESPAAEGSVLAATDQQGATVSETTEGTSSSESMIVFYQISDELYMFWCDMDAEIVDNGDGTWDIFSNQVTVSGLRQSVVAFGYYKYKEIVTNVDENGHEVATYMWQLGLEPMGAEGLPHSQHIGLLTAVNPALARPATVVRRYMGVNYSIQCLVSQSVVNMWLSGQLEVGDYVIVSFIDEIPDSTELNVAIVVDKVYKSW